jgi:putative ATP-dependent endonuclease of OLD family
VNAETDSQVAPLCQYFRNLGKTVIAVFDKQTEASRKAIEAVAHHSFECPDKGFEELVIDESAIDALRKYGETVVADGGWPTHLHAQAPNATKTDQEIRDAMRALFKHNKGEGCAADFLAKCSRAEMPKHIVDVLSGIKNSIEPKLTSPVPQATTAVATLGVTTGGP